VGLLGLTIHISMSVNLTEAYVYLHLTSNLNRIVFGIPKCTTLSLLKPQTNWSTIFGLKNCIYNLIYINKKNSMVWVRERTIPTERPPLVGEVIANVRGYRVPRGQRDGSLRPYLRFSMQEPLLFCQVAPQLYSRVWVDPVPDPLLFFLVVPGIEPRPPDL
jgi:hypothetical protein